MTWPLLEQVKNLHAIEVDKFLCAKLERQNEKKNGSLTVHCADARSFDYARLGKGRKLRLVGNLPYNLASPLLFYLLDRIDCVADMHFMLQAEVARNLAAPAGQPGCSRMGIMAACRVQVQRLFDVEAEAFSPPPKVRSTFVKMTPRETPWPAEQYQSLHRVVKKLFSARRKTLRRIFVRQLSDEALVAIGIPPTARPDNLDSRRLMALVNLLQQRQRENER